MNKMVQYMVELLFRDIQESDEIRALRDEVMANCQAHYDDLIRSGINEDEALAAVTESLQGMEQVVAQYPKKASAQAEPNTEKTPESGTCHDVISKMDLNLKGWNVAIVPSRTGRIDVHCDGADANHIETVFRQDTLVIREVMPQEEKNNTAEELKNLKWDNLDDMFSNLKKVAQAALQTVSNAIGSSGGTITIEVPCPLAEVNHRTVSGSLDIKGVEIVHLESVTTSGEIDIAVPGRMESLKAHSTSGNISVNALARKMDLKSISGEIEINGSCETMNLSTVSGDIDLQTRDVRPSQITLNSTSGDIDVRLEHTGIRQLNIHSISGDAEIVLPARENSFNLDLHSISGDCRSEIDNAGKKAETHIAVQTMSGDISVTRE